MNLKKLLLISASIAIGLVGIGYLVSADSMYARYGIEILSINEYSMVRGAYGGLFLSFAALFLVGAVHERFTLSSLVALFTFMFGFAIGRIASLLIDGTPSQLIFSLLAFEVFYSLASAYFIRSNLIRSGQT